MHPTVDMPPFSVVWYTSTTLLSKAYRIVEGFIESIKMLLASILKTKFSMVTMISSSPLYNASLTEIGAFEMCV